MGCVYSDQNKRSSKKNNNNNNNNNNNPPSPLSNDGNGQQQQQQPSDSLRRSNNNNNNNNDNNHHHHHNLNCPFQSSQRRIFKACTKNERQHGQIEITDNELIFHYGDSQKLEWPLKFLRSYGGSNGLFSFECGRKCSTGPGIYVFDCPQAKELFDTLYRQIGVMANSNNNHLNHNHHQNDGHLLSHLTHSQVQQQQQQQQQSTNVPLSHDYQNTSAERDMPLTNMRPGSKESQSRASHTYLNSTVIGQMKSQPNYYSSNPLSSSSYNGSSSGGGGGGGGGGGSRLNGSKHSLDETLNGTSFENHHYWPSSNGGGSDFRTLPSMRTSDNAAAAAAATHNYMNANVNTVNRLRRSSENNEYINFNSNKINFKKLQQIQSKMDETDNLGTFCYVNFDQNVKKDRLSAISGFKSRFARPNPETYVQLDLNDKKMSNQMATNHDETIAANGDDDSGVNNKKIPKNGDVSAATITAGTTKSWRNHMVNGTSSANTMAAIKQESKMFNNDNNNVVLENGGGKDKSKTCHGNHHNDNGNTTNKLSGSNSSSSNNNKTSVPYAEIDFAKTVALSNSTANHRKL